MSGGSYNYLCYADASTFSVHEAQRMIDRLRELGFEKEADETNHIIGLIACVDTELDKMRRVFEAVEWFDSCDGSLESVHRAIKLHRG